MKLAKKNGHAVLTFEINGLTRVGRRVKVSHDVKIEVMRPQDVARLNEPLCPEPDVRKPLLRVDRDLPRLTWSCRSTFFYLLYRN